MNRQIHGTAGAEGHAAGSAQAGANPGYTGGRGAGLKATGAGQAASPPAKPRNLAQMDLLA